MKISTNARWMIAFIAFAAFMGCNKIVPGQIVHNGISVVMSKVITK